MTDALIAARVLHLAATVVLVGAVVFQFCISAPTLGRTALPDARAMARFSLITIWIGLAVAAASGAAWFVALTAQITGDSGVSAWSSDALTLLTQTQFGRAMGVRLGIAALLAAALIWHNRWDGFGWIAVALAICFAGSLAWTGHSGAGDGPAGEVQIAADAFHLVAAAAWVGGLLPLAYLFMLAQRTASELAPATVAEATRRFSNIGIVSVATLLMTGLINTWFLVGSVAILLGSTYGRLLLLKVALFLVMVGIATVNRTRLTPAITANTAGLRTKAMRRLAYNGLIEAGLGLVIIAIVGTLGTLAPELPDEHHMHMHASPAAGRFVFETNRWDEAYAVARFRVRRTSPADLAGDDTWGEVDCKS